MSRLAQALATKREEIERPSVLPLGSYEWEVTGQYETRETDEWEMLFVPVKCVSPCDDVDEDELREFGKVEGIRNSASFFFPKDESDKNGFDNAVFQAERFVEACGLEKEGDESLEEALARLTGCRFMAPVTHAQDKKDPERINVNLGVPVAVGDDD